MVIKYKLNIDKYDYTYEDASICKRLAAECARGWSAVSPDQESGPIVVWMAEARLPLTAIGNKRKIATNGRNQTDSVSPSKKSKCFSKIRTRKSCPKHYKQ